MATMVKLKKPTEVGIKELKDQASAIVESVQKTGRPVIITKNRKAVAQIVPIAESSSEDVVQRWMDLGLLSRRGSGNWAELELLKIPDLSPGAAAEAVRAILKDREEGM